MKLKRIKLAKGGQADIPDVGDIEKPVLILGAGFTRGYNEHRVPLVVDFLDYAEKMQVLKPQAEHRILVDFIERYFGAYSNVNIETLATFLTSSLPPMPFPKAEPREFLFEQLTEIIVRTLVGISEHPHTESIRELYRKFTKELLRVQARVLTFNYDTLLDELLRETRKWSVLTGYGLKMQTGSEENQELRAFEEQQFIQKHKEPFKEEVVYLKLHGSINWEKPIIENPYRRPSIYLSPLALT